MISIPLVVVCKKNLYLVFGNPHKSFDVGVLIDYQKTKNDNNCLYCAGVNMVFLTGVASE